MRPGGLIPSESSWPSPRAAWSSFIRPAIQQSRLRLLFRGRFPRTVAPPTTRRQAAGRRLPGGPPFSPPGQGCRADGADHRVLAADVLIGDEYSFRRRWWKRRAGRRPFCNRRTETNQGPAAPVLPVKSARILLPAGRDLADVVVTAGDRAELPGRSRSGPARSRFHPPRREGEPTPAIRRSTAMTTSFRRSRPRRGRPERRGAASST